jgi:hypothetical protein
MGYSNKGAAKIPRGISAAPFVVFGRTVEGYGFMQQFAAFSGK